MSKNGPIKLIATNRKAYHDYHILETYEAGIVLTGTEVKSVREGKVNLKDSYATIKNGEAFVLNMHISPYHHGTAFNHEPTRTRKLLLHKQEIARLAGKVKERGLTLVPLKIYIKNGYVKLELALAKGKKVYDRRADIAKRDMDRELKREMKYKIKY
jgi:SsrA-binding protein